VVDIEFFSLGRKLSCKERTENLIVATSVSFLLTCDFQFARLVANGTANLFKDRGCI